MEMSQKKWSKKPVASGVKGAFGIAHSTALGTLQPGSPKDHETLFVANFIVPEKRQRWLEALANEKKRNRFLVALADDGDLVVGSMDRLTSGVDLETTHSLLLEAGAPELCWVISQWKSIDGQWMRLDAALEKCLGIGLGTVLSFIPGKLCFYEAEMPGNRWLLRCK